MDENRVVLYVDIFLVHGHHANSMDAHVRNIPNEVNTRLSIKF